MRIQKEKLVLFFFLVVSIFLGTFFWKFIKLPYTDPQIVGNYSLNKFNANNEILRYLFFIFLPILFYLIFKFFYEKYSVKYIKSLYEESSIQLQKTDLSLYIFFILIISLASLDFLSIEFPTHKLDNFHEGQKLSSAYKSFLDNSLWSGSYVTVGIFYETIGSKIIWSIFDHQSIGLTRYLDLVFIYVLKILLIILAFLIIKFLSFNYFYKNIFFIFNSFIFLNLFDYNTASTDLISFREIPIIIISILFLVFLINKNLKNYLIIMIGSLSILSLFWGIDRGLVCNLLILLIFLYLIIISDYQKLILLVVSIFSFWILFYFLLGNEFSHFISNTLYIFKEMNYVHGIIHPAPFSDDPNSARATKTLVLIIISIIITILLFFKSNKKFFFNFKLYLLFLSIIAFLSYVYALGRSDGPHIKHIFGYLIIFFSIYFSYLIIYYFEKKNIIKKFPNYSKNIFLLIFLIIFSYNFFYISIPNTKNYSERLIKYSFLPDNYFLNESEINFIKQAQPIVKDYGCIQLFTNEAAFLYLLKKKNCTKYYFVWSIGSKHHQNQLISRLNNSKIIVSNGPRNNWDFSLNKKLFLVNEYISKHYYNYRQIESWNILKLN